MYSPFSGAFPARVAHLSYLISCINNQASLFLFAKANAISDLPFSCWLLVQGFMEQAYHHIYQQILLDAG